MSTGNISWGGSRSVGGQKWWSSSSHPPRAAVEAGGRAFAGAKAEIGGKKVNEAVDNVGKAVRTADQAVGTIVQGTTNVINKLKFW
jgi:hypothetical protein